uniref:SAM-dependent MTase RsmB/NOP-type domain-containing protein n=2 Tax=Heterosigma akashiwo TaxID=2829 RepID=A0A6V1QKU6_HETAK
MVLPPQTTYLRVNTTKVTAEQVVEELQEWLSGEFQDRIAATGREVSKPYIHPILDDCVCIPNVPPRHQQDDWEFQDDGAGHRAAVVDRGCGEAVLRGAHVFACGLLAAGPYLRAGQTVDVYVDLEEGRGTTRGLDFRAYAKRKLHLGTGTMAVDRAAAFQTMRGLAVRMAEVVGGDAPPLNGALPGRVYGQNLSSMVVAHVLQPQPGETILDMCSAPGGKATHIAQRMGDRGLVVACDRTRRKAKHIRALCEELGLASVVPLCFDSRAAVVKGAGRASRTPPREVLEAAAPGKEGFPDLKAFYEETFDRVVLDPPCSALGLRPKLRCDLTMKELRSHVDLQRQLFWGAARLVRPGGVLVYSTCTVDPLENEGMVAWALEKHPFLELVAQEPMLGQAGLPGCGLSEEQRRLVQRFDPAVPTTAGDSTTGFFCAKFIKKNSTLLEIDDADNDDNKKKTSNATTTAA